jgi:hypothetical protein
MLILGPISSIYDFMIFFVLLKDLPLAGDAVSYRMVRGVVGSLNPRTCSSSARLAFHGATVRAAH